MKKEEWHGHGLIIRKNGHNRLHFFIKRQGGSDKCRFRLVVIGNCKLLTVFQHFPEFRITRDLYPQEHGSLFQLNVIGNVPVPVIKAKDRLLLPVDEGIAITAEKKYAPVSILGRFHRNVSGMHRKKDIVCLPLRMPAAVLFFGERFCTHEKVILSSYNKITEVHKKVAELPMTDFEIRRDDYPVQRSVFGDRYEVVANFSDDNYMYKDTVIAPNDLLFGEI